MIAPIIIASIVILYYVAIIVLFAIMPGIPDIVRVLMVVIPLILAGLLLGVLISRIKDFHGGEEDDLSQY